MYVVIIPLLDTILPFLYLCQADVLVLLLLTNEAVLYATRRADKIQLHHTTFGLVLLIHAAHTQVGVIRTRNVAEKRRRGSFVVVVVVPFLTVTTAFVFPLASFDVCACLVIFFSHFVPLDVQLIICFGRSFPPVCPPPV